jgi:tetratricopeptide (TPR) repeat protein
MNLGASVFGSGCPSELELTKAISLGAGASLSAHVEGCRRCETLWRQLARPQALARQLPWRAPGSAELEQTRTALLVSLARERAGGARERRPVRGLLVFAMPLALAAAALVVWWAAPRSKGGPLAVAESSRAVRVSSQPAASTGATNLVSPVEAVQPIEKRGTASAPAHAEVHGTSVRMKVAGDRRESVPAPSPAEAAFVEAWSAFRAGRFGGAINAFGDVLRLDPAGPLAEDARYWRAVAMARTGALPRNIIDEVAAFLRQYPHSAHADEASLLLGWKLVDAGRRDEAARYFQVALQARAKEVRESARAGIDGLGRGPSSAQ